MTTQQVTIITPTERVARLSEIASVVEAAHVDPWNLSISRDGNITIQCIDADDVDSVMELLDDAPSPYASGHTLYTRWATFDEVIGVQVYGPARAGGCSCGHACDHKDGGR
jgi:hypothetical protein